MDSWKWVFLILFLSDFVILMLPAPSTTTEDTAQHQVCFVALLNHPRDRDVVYEFILSNSSTATPGADFYIQPNITISTTVDEDVYRFCIYIDIFEDTIVEENEMVVYYVRPLAQEDSVNGSQTLVVTLIDDDGNDKNQISIAIPHALSFIIILRDLCVW